MSERRSVNVEMQESYMRATIYYDNESYYSEICDCIESLEKSKGLHPEVAYSKESDTKGFCCIEFSGDEYSNNRDCGDFIEELIATLDIKNSSVN